MAQTCHKRRRQGQPPRGAYCRYACSPQRSSKQGGAPGRMQGGSRHSRLAREDVAEPGAEAGLAADAQFLEESVRPVVDVVLEEAVEHWLPAGAALIERHVERAAHGLRHALGIV